MPDKFNLYDVYEQNLNFLFGAGASFVARESVIDPKKLERSLVKGFSHKGFSFMEVLSNCHINLGRKNKNI